MAPDKKLEAAEKLQNAFSRLSDALRALDEGQVEVKKKRVTLKKTELPERWPIAGGDRTSAPRHNHALSIKDLREDGESMSVQLQETTFSWKDTPRGGRNERNDGYLTVKIGREEMGAATDAQDGWEPSEDSVLDVTTIDKLVALLEAAREAQEAAKVEQAEHIEERSSTLRKKARALLR